MKKISLIIMALLLLASVLFIPFFNGGHLYQCEDEGSKFLLNSNQHSLPDELAFKYKGANCFRAQSLKHGLVLTTYVSTYDWTDEEKEQLKEDLMVVE